MRGLGTLVNVAAILLGGLLGLCFGKKLHTRIQDTLLKAMGLGVLFVGLSGTLQQMFFLQDGALQTQGSLMMVVSLALGALCGEALNLEDAVERFGEFLKEKTGNSRDGGFVQAFVTASITVCIGAMAIVGSIQDGMTGNHEVLFLKSLFDLVVILAMSAGMGKGCLFAALPVGLCQGLMTLGAGLLAPVFTDAALSNLSLTGSILVFCVGINLIFGKRIRIANLLPCLVFSVAWAYIF